VHDFGPYTVLGVTFTGDGSRLFDIIVQHKNESQQQSASGRFLGYRLFKFFGYDDPEPEIINALADVFDTGTPQHDIKNMLRTIFTPGNLVSEAFYSERAFKAHVKSPTEFLVSSYRLLKPDGIQLTYPTSGTPAQLDVPQELRLALGSLNQMGQLLFSPPDVSGWKEGLNWINTTFDLARFNYANSFVAGAGRVQGAITTEALRNLLIQNEAQTPEQVVDYFTDLLLQVNVSTEIRTTLVNYLLAGANGTPGGFNFNLSNDTTINNKVRGLIHLIMASQDFQLS
jgi:uncharacterized protein (DUF1800 family)